MSFAISCGECGAWFKSKLALTKHTGSRPCQLVATQRRMRVRGWAVATAPDALYVLGNTAVDYEVAPGEILRGHGPGGWDLIKRPWCASWVARIVNCDVHFYRTRRAAIINVIYGDEAKIAAWQVAVAIDPLAAFLAYSGG